MDRELAKLIRRFWWIKSQSALGRFQLNPFAQGYELFRRSSRFKGQLGLSPGRIWPELYQAERDHFALTFYPLLVRAGLLKRIFVSPKIITFDCTLPPNYLLHALDSELANPTPLAIGERNGFMRVIAPSFHPAAEEKLHVPIEKRSWKACREPEIIELTIPETVPDFGAPRRLTGGEVHAYFRTFIKDNPPLDFAEHRRRLCAKRKMPRREDARTIALGLMALDCNSTPGALKDLADWFIRKRKEKSIFGMEKDAFVNRLYHSKSSIYRILKRVERSV